MDSPTWIVRVRGTAEEIEETIATLRQIASERAPGSTRDRIAHLAAALDVAQVEQQHGLFDETGPPQPITEVDNVG